MAGAVGKGPASTPEDLPGKGTNVITSLLGQGAKLLQSLKPINKIHAHLCAFHFYAHDMKRQVEAHHYCTHYNQDMRQCLIYDSPEKNARLIGVEYIVSEKLFQGLPDEEKKFWHTHEYEVKGGILFMPGVPQAAEHKELEEVAKTYGKVFHFWQYDRGDTLPLGLPQLMMAFTEDGQLNPNLAKSVEDKFGVSFQKHAESRKHMTGPSMGIHPLANPWLKGTGLQSELREVDIKENSSASK